MARIYKNPKPYSRKLDYKYTKIIFVIIGVTAWAALIYWRLRTESIVLAFLGFLVVGFFINSSDFIFKLMDKNDRGEKGERDVRKVLEQLPDDYAVFQNVPVRKNLDVDLVVVGPTGVYAIEVKSHRHFTLRGDGKDFVQETLSETFGLKEALNKSGQNIYVNSLLVFSRAFVKYQIPQQGVNIMNKRFVMPYLQKRINENFDRNLAEETIKSLYVR